MLSSSFKFFVPFIVASLTACSGINDSWEVKGGGFIKYSINDSTEINQELERNDVEIPFIRNQHHYLLITIPAKRSSRHDQLSIMINDPRLGKNSVIPGYTWIQVNGSPKAYIKGDSNYVNIDNIRFCEGEKCEETVGIRAIRAATPGESTSSPRLRIQNNKLFVEKNGKRFDLTGHRIK